MKFSSFIDIKNKQTIKQLEILKEILSKDFQIETYLENEDPYIYLKAKKDTPFQGVRVYKIGSNWAYRIQNESQTEPYGKAYPIDLEKMFEDIIPDMSEEEAGGVIADALVEEFNNFFDKSAKLDKEFSVGQFNKNDISNSSVIVGSNSGDFSNSIYNK
jgi:hypothetical protein